MSAAALTRKGLFLCYASGAGKAVGAHSLALSLLILSAGSSAGDTLQFIIDKFAALLLAKLFRRSTRSSNFR
jgi:hypothetical protein